MAEGRATCILRKWNMEIRSATGAPNWYALFTRHQHEKSVAFALSNKCHEVYLPLYRVRSPVAGPGQAALVSHCSRATCLFGRGWTGSSKSFTTPGVVHIVGMGRAPGDYSADAGGCGQASY